MISCEFISSKREGWREGRSEEDKHQTKDVCLSLWVLAWTSPVCQVLKYEVAREFCSREQEDSLEYKLILDTKYVLLLIFFPDKLYG